MVSSNDAGFNLRGKSPLSQNFARWDSQWEEMYDIVISYTMAALSILAALRMTWINLMYPMSTEEPAIAGTGCLITATYTIS
jgi:hypothetical protein